MYGVGVVSEVVYQLPAPGLVDPPPIAEFGIRLGYAKVQLRISIHLIVILDEAETRRDRHARRLGLADRQAPFYKEARTTPTRSPYTQER